MEPPAAQAAELPDPFPLIVSLPSDMSATSVHEDPSQASVVAACPGPPPPPKTKEAVEVPDYAMPDSDYFDDTSQQSFNQPQQSFNQPQQNIQPYRA